MAKKRAPKRGSAEERWYYTTKEGLASVDIDDDFDWRRGLELLFEDAPEVNLEHCRMEYFQNLRDAGVITKEECDIACEIGATMMAHKFCSAQAKMPLSEKILVAFFGGPWAVWTWMIVLIIISAIVQCMNN